MLGGLYRRIVGRKLGKVRYRNSVIERGEFALDQAAIMFLQQLVKPLEKFLTCRVATVKPDGIDLGGYFLTYFVPAVAVVSSIKPV
jgi:hypothetical protein